MPVPKLCNFRNEDVAVTGHYIASGQLITYRIDIKLLSHWMLWSLWL